MHAKKYPKPAKVESREPSSVTAAYPPTKNTQAQEINSVERETFIEGAPE
jgi:hypothetical protein